MDYIITKDVDVSVRYCSDCKYGRGLSEYKRKCEMDMWPDFDDQTGFFKMHCAKYKPLTVLRKR